MIVPSNENVTGRRGVKATRLASRVALTPRRPRFRSAPNSFLWLGRCAVLDDGCLPEGVQACIDFIAQQQRIGLLIERLQALLLLLTENTRRDQTLIGRLGLIPFPPYLVAFDNFFAQ